MLGELPWKIIREKSQKELHVPEPERPSDSDIFPCTCLCLCVWNISTSLCLERLSEPASKRNGETLKNVANFDPKNWNWTRASLWVPVLCLLAKDISTSMCLERYREESSKESKEEENEDLKVKGKNFDTCKKIYFF